MRAAHTPTPWRTDSAECSTDAVTYIYGADGSDFAHVPTEDGDHIVRCVNAHDELVAALQYALKTMELERSVKLSEGGAGICAPAIGMARAALAKVAA